MGMLYFCFLQETELSDYRGKQVEVEKLRRDLESRDLQIQEHLAQIEALVETELSLREEITQLQLDYETSTTDISHWTVDSLQGYLTNRYIDYASPSDGTIYRAGSGAL
jgi:hypothetical protein